MLIHKHMEKRLMTDTQHSTLNTPCICLGIPECRM